MQNKMLKVVFAGPVGTRTRYPRVQERPSSTARDMLTRTLLVEDEWRELKPDQEAQIL